MDFDEKRETWVDITKGMIILLVVMGHIFDSFIHSNIYMNNLEVFEYGNFTFNSFDMPLFMLLSGYLYSKVKKINTLEQYKNLILEKLLNLMIPYFIFSILQVSINIIFSSKVNAPLGLNDLISIPIKPVLQFWFLYALMIIFIIVPLLEIIFKNDKIVFIILLIMYIVAAYIKIDIILLDHFFVYAFYFYCGKILHTYLKPYITKKNVLVVGSLLYILLNIMVYFILGGKASSWIVYVLLAITGSLLTISIVNIIFFFKHIKKIFYTIGLYSFHIYLLHILFTSGSRIIINKTIGMNSFFLNFTAMLAMGIICPMIIGILAKNIPIFNIFFYPSKYIIKRKNKDKISSKIHEIA